jgi:5-formyltetrahydrofolate cyclo-ligase
LDKDSLRKDMRDLRKTLSLSKAERIFMLRHLTSITQAPTTIAAYERMGAELDPAFVVKALRADGHRVVMPDVIGDGLMRFAAEPAVILTPLLAFDRGGGRLGQGGGYYDRYFASSDALKVGIAYAEQEAPDLPLEPHDQRLDWILTPKEAIKVE